jgi:hypothetical protein
MNVELIRDAIRRHPFRAFTLRLADGRSVGVSHPEFVATGNRFVFVVNPADDSTLWIEPLLIVSLDYSGAVAPGAPPTSNGNPGADAPSGS